MEWVLNGKGGLESCAQLDSGGAAPLHYAAIAKNGAILSAILSKVRGTFGTYSVASYPGFFVGMIGRKTRDPGIHCLHMRLSGFNF